MICSPGGDPADSPPKRLRIREAADGMGVSVWTALRRIRRLEARTGIRILSGSGGRGGCYEVDPGALRSAVMHMLGI